MGRVPGGFGVSRPDRSVSLERPLQDASTDTRLKDLERAAELAEELESVVGRMPPGSFTLDPGMRAADEFTDVTSPGYREQAKRVAERGGATEYATSVEEEAAGAEADALRNRIGLALGAMSAVGMATGAAGAFGAARGAGAGLGTAMHAAGRGAVGRAPVMYRGGQIFEPPGLGLMGRVPDPVRDAAFRSGYGPSTIAHHPSSVAARGAAQDRAIRDAAMQLRTGAGPNAQAAVPGAIGRQGTPAVRDFGPPPPPWFQGSPWEWMLHHSRRGMGG